MAQETSSAFRIGSVIERSFAIYLRNFIAFSLIVSAPLLMNEEPTSTAFAWNAGLTGLVDVPLTALGSVVATVTYHDLRTAKDGIGVAEIARVFD